MEGTQKIIWSKPLKCRCGIQIMSICKEQYGTRGWSMWHPWRWELCPGWKEGLLARPNASTSDISIRAHPTWLLKVNTHHLPSCKPPATDPFWRKRKYNPGWNLPHPNICFPKVGGERLLSCSEPDIKIGLLELILSSQIYAYLLLAERFRSSPWEGKREAFSNYTWLSLSCSKASILERWLLKGCGFKRAKS